MRLKEYLEIFGLILMSLSIRLLFLGTAFTADASSWLNRFQQFTKAVLNVDFASTYLTSHPGVTSLWMSGFMLKLKGFIFPGPYIHAYTSNPNFLPTNIYKIAFWAYLPYVLVSVFAIVMVFILVKRLFNKDVAWLSSGLLAFSPFFVGYSRHFNQDCILASFSIITILYFLLYLKEDKLKFLVYSGIFFGLSFLTKFPAIFIALGVGIILLLSYYTKSFYKKGLNPVTTFASWSGIGAITYILLFPALWITPFKVIGNIFFKAIKFSSDYSKVTYFLGQMTRIEDIPGYFYYLIYISVKVTPIVLIAFFIGCIYIFTKQRFKKESRNVFYLLIFFASFFFMMSTGNVKSATYIMFLIPIIIIIASVTIIAFIDKYCKRLSLKIMLPILILFFQLFSVLSVAPYFAMYYSPLWGNYANTARLLPDMAGQGMEQGAQFINDKEQYNNFTVAAWYPQIYYMMNKGRTVNLVYFMQSDYVLFYKNQLERGYDKQLTDFYFNNAKPIYVHNFKGVNTTYIFENTPEILNKLKGEK